MASSAVVADSPLGSEVCALRAAFSSLWVATPRELPDLGPRVGFFAQFRHARAARRLIEEMAAEVPGICDDEHKRAIWRASARERLQRFGGEHLGWPRGYRRLVFGDAFFDASVTFARMARAFCPESSQDSVGQALRNVWIGNSIQMLVGLPVRLDRGLFAYSMLYPLTDNLLDDPDVGPVAKQAFNRRLGWRLAGCRAAAADAAEAAVFAMIDQIEVELPRRDYADVYESLQAIHRAQVLSLRQQDDRGISDEEILAISCEKGGTSVLTDLYLVSRRPSPEERRFAFGYGVFLQFLDDLQDATQDLAVGHQTLFTRAAESGPLDALAGRLLRFIDQVLDGQGLPMGPDLADRKDLIRRNCRSLLVGAVVEQPRLFTGRFRHTLCSHWPFSLRAMRRLRRHAERCLREAGSAVRRRTGAASVTDWVLAQESEGLVRARPAPELPSKGR